MKKITIFFIVFTISIISNAQYVTSGNGTAYTLSELILPSGGVVEYQNETNNYLINNNLTISSTDTLLILESETILFVPNMELIINGVLKCMPNSGEVIFSCNTVNQYFKGISFENSDASILKNANISMCGGISLVSSDVLIDNCLIFNNNRENSTNSIDIFQSAPTISNCVLQHNEGPAIGSGANSGSSPTILNNYIFENNTLNDNRPQINLGSSGNDTIYIIGNEIIGAYNMVGGIAVTTLSGGDLHCWIEDNIIHGNRYGITAYGYNITSLIRNNFITDNNIQNLPMQGGSGINFYGDASNTSIVEGNEITGNLWGVTIQNSAQPNFGDNVNSFGYNRIFNNGNSGEIFDIYNNTPQNINAINNWWGSDNVEDIENHIFHSNDDISLGTVTYEPFFSEPFGDYIPMAKEDALWSVSTEKFIFSGDTIIQSRKYKKLYSHEGFENLTPEELVYRGAIREIPIYQKVIFIEAGTETEKLLYDFSLQTSDIVNVSPFNSPMYSLEENYKIEILNTEEVLIGSEIRKKLTINTVRFDYNEYWIEGIGSTMGLAYPGASKCFGICGSFPYLLCYEENGVLIYDDEFYDVCYRVTALEIEQEEQNGIILFPNVTSDIFNIKFSEEYHQNFVVEIWNSSGMCVLRDDSKTEFNISNFDSGIYNVKVIFDNKVEVFKLIKI